MPWNVILKLPLAIKIDWHFVVVRLEGPDCGYCVLKEVGQEINPLWVPYKELATFRL